MGGHFRGDGHDAAGFALQIVVNVLVLARVVRWQWTAWRTRIDGWSSTIYCGANWGLWFRAAANYLPLLLFSGFSAGALTALNYKRMSRVPMDMLIAILGGNGGEVQ